MISWYDGSYLAWLIENVTTTPDAARVKISIKGTTAIAPQYMESSTSFEGMVHRNPTAKLCFICLPEIELFGSVIIPGVLKGIFSAASTSMPNHIAEACAHNLCGQRWHPVHSTCAKCSKSSQWARQAGDVSYRCPDCGHTQEKCTFCGHFEQRWFATWKKNIEAWRSNSAAQRGIVVLPNASSKEFPTKNMGRGQLREWTYLNDPRNGLAVLFEVFTLQEATTMIDSVRVPPPVVSSEAISTSKGPGFVVVEWMSSTAQGPESHSDAYVVTKRINRVTFPEPTGIQINMMPFVMGKKDSLPEQYHQYWTILHDFPISNLGQVGYLTINEGIVIAGNTQRRGGLHTESPGMLSQTGKHNTIEKVFLTGEFGKGRQKETLDQFDGGIYMVSTVDHSCRVYDAQIASETIGYQGDIEHMRGLLTNKAVKSLELLAGSVVWMTDRTPHEALPMKQSGIRQFLRVVAGHLTHWHALHNTPNPLGIQPDAEIVHEDKFKAIQSGPQEPQVTTSTEGPNLTVATQEMTSFEQKVKGLQTNDDAVPGETKLTLAVMKDLEKAWKAYSAGRVKEVKGGNGLYDRPFDGFGSALAIALNGNPPVSVLDREGNRLEHEAIPLVRFLSEKSIVEYCNLNCNHIGDEGCEPIASLIKMKKTLVKLCLSENNFGPQTAAPFADALKVNNTLTHLDLSKNVFGETAAQSFAQALEQNSSLTWLDLRGNKIVGEASHTLAMAVLNHPGLVEFGSIPLAKLRANDPEVTLLSITEFGPVEAEVLGAMFKVSSSLRVLQVGVTKRYEESLCPQTVQTLTDALKEPNTIEELYIKNWRMSKNGVSLFEMLKVNSTLQRLDIRDQKLGYETNGKASSLATMALVNSLKVDFSCRSNSTLTDLDVRKNGFEGAAATELALAVLEHKSMKFFGGIPFERIQANDPALTLLSFESSGFGPAESHVLAHLLKGNTTVTSLSVRDNECGKYGIQQLAHLLQVNTTLLKLDLTKNDCSISPAGGSSSAGNRQQAAERASGGQAGLALAEALRVNHTLQFLVASDCKLGPEGSLALIQGAQGNNTLLHLNVSSNFMEKDGVEAAAALLKENTMLKSFDVSGHDVPVETAINLANSALTHRVLERFGKLELAALKTANCSLIHLELNCSIDEVVVLAEVLKTNTSVTQLNITNKDNQQGYNISASVGQLSDMLTQNKSLKKLNIASSFDTKGSKVLAQTVASHFSIEEFGHIPVAQLRASSPGLVELNLQDKFTLTEVLVLAQLLKENKSVTALMLKKITYENKQYTGFSEVVAAVAEIIKGSKSLQKLDLGTTELDSRNIWLLTTALMSNSSLTEFNVSDLSLSKIAQLNGGAVRLSLEGKLDGKHVANRLKVNQVLKELVLDGNKLKADETLEIAKALEVNGTLETLKILNSSWEPAANQLSDMLKVNTVLKSLHLSGNAIKDVGVGNLIDAIMVNKTLMTLSLTYNSISGVGAEGLGEAFKFNVTLTHVDLSNNKFKDLGAAFIADALRVNYFIKHLNILGNEIGSVGVQFIADAVKANLTLLTLEMETVNPKLSLSLEVNALWQEWTASPGNHSALDPNGIWIHWVSSDKNVAPLRISEFFSYFTVRELLSAQDGMGRNVLDVATPECRKVIVSKVYLCGVYELDWDQQPVHESATCKVVLATDHSAEYGNDDGSVAEKENNVTAVALKFMRHKDQWLRELQARQGVEGEGALNQQFVVDVVRFHSADDEPGLLAALQEHDWTEFPHCLVMPCADRSLADVLSHEHLAPSPREVHWDEVRNIFVQVAQCLVHLHDKRSTIHGDVKPLNLMRVGDTWKLIDLDAATRFGHPTGAKSSSAFCAPEMVHLGADGRQACIKTSENCPNPALACAALDVWSLGVVFFEMCTGRPLFDAFANDTLDEGSLLKLAAWSSLDVKAKTSEICNRMARNLISFMLAPKAEDRLSLAEVLNHPFVTGQTVKGRLRGEEAFYDMFIGYRVSTDQGSAQSLFSELTRRGFRVFWDKVCLPPGKDWEASFCDALVHSRVFVPVLSRAALFGPQNDTSKLGVHSRCDNVLLEHAMVLELQKRELIERIIPVLLDQVTSDNVANVSVDSINQKLAYYLLREDLGAPIEAEPCAQGTVRAIFSAGLLEGVGLGDLAAAAAVLDTTLRGMNSKPRFDVLISFRDTCADDEEVAIKLQSLLCANGVRASASPTSPAHAAAAALLEPSTTPLVLVVIQSAAALEPLNQLGPASPADSAAVEWTVATLLQARERLRYIYPVFLGGLDIPTGRRGVFSSWGSGSDEVVPSVSRRVAGLLNCSSDSVPTSKQAMVAINRNQGQMVDFRLEYTLEAAASKIRTIVMESTSKSDTDSQLDEARIGLSNIKNQLAQAEAENMRLKEVIEAGKAT